MTRARIPIPQPLIAAFCQKHHIVRLSLFGSVLRDDFTPESDVDVLVEFAPEHTPGYFRYFDMQEELAGLLGRKVDLLTEPELSRYFRQEVLSEAETQYVSPS
jgi:uncharacterized protein